MDYDVIVVGAGLAGMVAGYTAHEKGARVLIIDRGAIGTGTNSIIANGVFSGPSEGYEPDEYVRETIKIGKGINNGHVVDIMARDASRAIMSLCSFGLEIDMRLGLYTVKPSRPGIIRGVTMVKKIAEIIGKTERIECLTGFYAAKILKQNNRVAGIRGFNAKGEDLSVYAPSVVLATGGLVPYTLETTTKSRSWARGMP